MRSNLGIYVCLLMCAWVECSNSKSSKASSCVIPKNELSGRIQNKNGVGFECEWRFNVRLEHENFGLQVQVSNLKCDGGGEFEIGGTEYCGESSFSKFFGKNDSGCGKTDSGCGTTCVDEFPPTIYYKFGGHGYDSFRMDYDFISCGLGDSITRATIRTITTRSVVKTSSTQSPATTTSRAATPSKTITLGTQKPKSIANRLPTAIEPTTPGEAAATETVATRPITTDTSTIQSVMPRITTGQGPRVVSTATMRVSNLATIQKSLETTTEIPTTAKSQTSNVAVLLGVVTPSAFVLLAAALGAAFCLRMRGKNKMQKTRGNPVNEASNQQQEHVEIENILYGQTTAAGSAQATAEGTSVRYSPGGATTNQETERIEVDNILYGQTTAAGSAQATAEGTSVRFSPGGATTTNQETERIEVDNILYGQTTAAGSAQATAEGTSVRFSPGGATTTN